MYDHTRAGLGESSVVLRARGCCRSYQVVVRPPFPIGRGLKTVLSVFHAVTPARVHPLNASSLTILILSRQSRSMVGFLLISCSNPSHT